MKNQPLIGKSSGSPGTSLARRLVCSALFFVGSLSFACDTPFASMGEDRSKPNMTPAPSGQNHGQMQFSPSQVISPDPIIVGVGVRWGAEALPVGKIGEQMGLDARKLQKLMKRTGTRVLHRMKPSETMEELAMDAAIEAMENATLYDISEIDGLFASTSSPSAEYTMPGVARIVGNRLNMKECNMTNVGQGCCGGIDALLAAYNQLREDSRNGVISTYLVLSGDHTSRVLNPDDLPTAFLFSEGAAALVVTNRPAADGFVIERMGSRALHGDIYSMRIRNERVPGPDDIYFHMDGEHVFEFVARKVAPNIAGLLRWDSIPEGIVIVPHQPSLAALRQLEFQTERTVYKDGITKYGNMTGGSVFFSLFDYVDTQLSSDSSQPILLLAFGAELKIAAAHLIPKGEFFKVTGRIK